MIVLDTGVLYAATDRRDAHHAVSAALLDSRADDVVILPVPVLIETAWLVQRRLGTRIEAGLIAAAAAGDFTLHDLTAADWERVSDLLETYHDLDLGTVDASVVATAERYRACDIATLNHRDFTVVRPRHTDEMRLLP